MAQTVAPAHAACGRRRRRRNGARAAKGDPAPEHEAAAAAADAPDIDDLVAAIERTGGFAARRAANVARAEEDRKKHAVRKEARARQRVPTTDRMVKKLVAPNK